MQSLYSRATAAAGVKADLGNFSWLLGGHTNVLCDILRGMKVLQLPSRATPSAAGYILPDCLSQDFSLDLFCGFLSEAGIVSHSKK